MLFSWSYNRVNFIYFYFQVMSLLNDVDPNFIEKYIPRKNLISLNCFQVTPNCHRVTEVPYAISNGNRLSFVSIYVFSFVLVLFISCDNWSYPCFFNITNMVNFFRMRGQNLVRNWLISGVHLMS